GPVRRGGAGGAGPHRSPGCLSRGWSRAATGVLRGCAPLAREATRALPPGDGPLHGRRRTCRGGHAAGAARGTAGSSLPVAWPGHRRGRLAGTRGDGRGAPPVGGAEGYDLPGASGGDAAGSSRGKPATARFRTPLAVEQQLLPRLGRGRDADG